MSFELTRIMTFETKEQLARSLEFSKASLSMSAFLTEFVGFLKANRLDDIERMVAEGKLEVHFPRFESAEVPLRKWDEIERDESAQMTQERYDRFLAGS